MSEYPDIYLDRDFIVEVTPCETTLTVSSLLSVPNKQITWGDDALPYDIGAIFASGYVQTPACGYPLLYDIYYEDVIGSAGVLDL